MIGAIIGDIAGSRFEFHNHRSKEFTLLDPACYFTDDSVLTLAVGKALLEAEGDLARLPKLTEDWMHTLGRPYPDCGYGGRFLDWMYGPDPKPYNSFGNGSAMRVSACGWAADTREEVCALAEAVTAVTHNHPEGIKGAEATAVAILMARQGRSKEDIRRAMEEYYPLDFTLDEIRDTYGFWEICQKSVPQALEAFLEAESFEDTIRGAVSIGGDSDTIAAIAGSIAEAYYGVSDELRAQAESFLDERLLAVLRDCEAKWPPVQK